MTDTIPFPRYGQLGYYTALDLPRSAPMSSCVLCTGWVELDGIYKLYAEQFTIVTGKPGHGKSTFVFNLVINFAQLHGMRSFLYVPENERSLYDKLRKVWMARDLRDDADRRYEYFLGNQVFVQSNRLAPSDHMKTIQWVLHQATIAVERDKCELLVLDPWNWIERARGRDQLLTDYINDCLYDVKDFAQRNGVSVIMVAHPTKAVNEHGGRVPSLYDIEGSANWANKCDNGLVVHRDNDAGYTKVISQKVREEPEAGTLGVRNFHVDSVSGLFRPMVGAASDFDEHKARKHYSDRR